ncbi:MAG: hypothetical protein ISS47_07920 [Candidatus Omnitrophica bacterium]|nr:hypothetical protein [Candidatus Omnitrophota bacterium]
MPIEIKKISEGWKIVYIDYIENPRGGWVLMTRFEVTSPYGDDKSIRPIFTMEFIDDYFRIPGDRGMTERRSALIKEKEELLKRWSLVRIEECIDKDLLEEEPKIMSKDFGWAEKIEKGYLIPASTQQDENTYIYIPERKIGFK